LNGIEENTSTPNQCSGSAFKIEKTAAELNFQCVQQAFSMRKVHGERTLN
jgi:hypothetical protein